jgi:hypothetical protein
MQRRNQLLRYEMEHRITSTFEIHYSVFDIESNLPLGQSAPSGGYLFVETNRNCLMPRQRLPFYKRQSNISNLNYYACIVIVKYLPDLGLYKPMPDEYFTGNY